MGPGSSRRGPVVYEVPEDATGPTTGCTLRMPAETDATAGPDG